MFVIVQLNILDGHINVEYPHIHISNFDYNIFWFTERHFILDLWFPIGISKFKPYIKLHDPRNHLRIYFKFLGKLKFPHVVFLQI